MEKLLELEKQELRLRLTRKMEEFIDEVGSEDNNLGYLPNNIDSLMSNAAFEILLAVNATNQLMEEEGLLKD